MKTTLRLLAFITISCICCAPRAQTVQQDKFLISVHAGPSWLVDNLIGITDYNSEYTDPLRNGIDWSGEFTYLFGRASIKGGIGLLYQGSRYTNHIATSSDEINMNYVTPQISLFYVRDKFLLRAGLGAGYMFYRDHSTVYDKPRNVSFNRIACNMTAGGEYRILSNWGISMRVDWMLSGAKTYSVSYHDTEWKVSPQYPINASKPIQQLSLSAGINYHF